MSKYRYGPYDDGPDPLAPPYDVRRALDELGDRVLSGDRPEDALRDLLHRGAGGRRGLDELRRQAAQRRKEIRRRGRADGTLDEVRALVDTAIGQERAQLFGDADDDARFREARLDAVPPGTAQAISDLSNYDWRSPEAAQTFAEAQDLLRREVLDSRFAGMKQALENATPEDMDRVRNMLADLNEMLAADERGELTQDQFDQFMEQYGDFFPDNPQNLEELVDSLARRMAAAQRMMASLTPEQRDELAQLSEGVFNDLGMSAEMSRLADALRSRRPDLDWDGGSRLSGDQPLGMGDATTAFQDLSDAEELMATLGQDYPGASLDDVDEEAVRRALGRGALDDLAELRRIQRELEAQGWLNRSGGRLELTPKAVRRIAQAALRKVFASLAARQQGTHEIHSAGAAGELTGSTRAWQFGDEQPIDVVRTLTNAVRRGGVVPAADGGDGRIRLAVEDFEVAETERRGRAAVSVLIDMSYSMVLRDTWTQAKTTALALHALVTGMYPSDAVQLIGFSRYAQEISPTDLATLEPDYVQGTNLQHALLLAGKFLEQHPGSERIVLIVTDGEPTAHLTRDGGVYFDWPPAPSTLSLTYAQVDAMTRRGAALNIFSLDEDPRLAAFCEEVARRSGGRVFYPDPDRLGDYVVSDYLRLRNRNARRAG
ncbi:MAG TPA: VWA domain-containing protein [Sporichthya sp.]|nr:VWA domain-containing protein [Sporichthya sp.]